MTTEWMITSKPEQPYELEEIGGDRYPSLEAVQAALLEPLAEALVACIRKRLAIGALVVSDGKVVFAEEVDDT